MSTKIKTNKAAAKRFKFTASGKVKYKKSNARHILTKKSPNRKRRFRCPGYLVTGDQGHVERLLPYAG